MLYPAATGAGQRAGSGKGKPRRHLLPLVGYFPKLRDVPLLVVCPQAAAGLNRIPADPVPELLVTWGMRGYVPQR